ncbi:hypothetical protein K443DRAFT_90169 [Laccaria amethystina LaAM-08-1]|uniref:Presequence translocated-associated motor subunit PAM17 n=1 Tax=Laccaria amethystina LaAM-08-1 TaxID=1095629 RepID=A0A0C9Y7B1_9AGAR|nr:hypothetical protein K443DRAFT_90169 [Laccaria amethystina LaAM-08-1]
MLTSVARSATRQLVKKPRTVSRLKSTTASAATTPATLTWPEYLAIKRNKRKWQMAVTFPCAMLGFASGVAYFGTLETDPMKPILGIDPFFFYGICTVGCVGVGAILGPTVGTALWRFTHRRSVHLIDSKDHQFFQRIAKNRVDASLQSPTAPVPDYYGEKIGSLHQYRQWLRDQGKYKRKAVFEEK